MLDYPGTNTKKNTFLLIFLAYVGLNLQRCESSAPLMLYYFGCTLYHVYALVSFIKTCTWSSKDQGSKLIFIHVNLQEHKDDILSD